MIGWRALAAVFLMVPGCAGAATLPLAVELRARELAPGEPVRIVVRADRPLARLAGTFLDLDVHFVGAADGRSWSGWSLIPLDRQPGPGAVEVAGTTADGAACGATRAVEVVAREFPVEQLSVASRYVTPPPDVERRLEHERAKLAAIYRTRRDEAAGQPFLHPVPGDRTSVFGTRRLFNGEPRSPHPGVDLRAATGDPVVASGPGKVVLAEELYYSGNTVIIDHGGGLFTLYAHLSRIDVADGDDVAGGDPIGLVGATGRVTGPHLHWGAKIGDRPFDPAALTDPSLFE